MMQIFSKQRKNCIYIYIYIYIMIVKFYFFWTFWQLFRIKVRQSASDTEP